MTRRRNWSQVPLQTLREEQLRARMRSCPYRLPLVLIARQWLANGWLHRDVAEWTGMSLGTVKRISAGHTFWWVTEGWLDTDSGERV